jgi:capsular exopolysaccharide synthesis family protein
MGKVYDALRRAEEQRARRVKETAAGGAPVLPDLSGEPLVTGAARTGPLAAPPPVERRSLWQRLGLWRRPAREATDALNKRRIALLQPDSYLAEQFRTLRARIDSVASTHPEHRLCTLAVTSALPGDGKTMASVSLAAVTSMAPGRRTLLVECDMRQPSIARALGLRLSAGLAEVIQGDAKPEEAIQRVDGTELDVLAVRGIPANPAELLGSVVMRQLLELLASRYDRIVLDLPPTLGLPDAKTVSEICDGIIFVVRADGTPEADVTAALDVLDRRRVLGVVLNGTEREPGRYEYRS